MKNFMRNRIHLVIIIGVFFCIPFFAAAKGSSLYLSPSSGSFFLGSTFDVSIILNTGDQTINTIEAELKFPPDKLQVANPALGKSIVQIWATNPTFSNREGRVYFVGGIPSPGIKISEGIVITMTFRVVGLGSSTIEFRERTKVYANDGSGTNILDQATPGSYTFSSMPPAGPQVFSPTHPDQVKWYNNPSPTISWVRESDVDDFSYVLDENPNGFPDTVGEGSGASISYEKLEDGIWYFHIRAKKGGVWGGVSHFVLNIDQKPPASFPLAVNPSHRTTTKNPILRFFTTDSLSGLSHYSAKIISLQSNNREQTPFFFEIESPYQLTELVLGRYRIIVRAYDNASNNQDAEATLDILSSRLQLVSREGIDLIFVFLPWGRFFLFLLGLLLFILIIIAILWWLHHPHITKSIREDVIKAKKIFHEH